MRRLLIFAVFFLFIAFNSFSQKIISDGKEVKELKEVSGQYTQVTIQGALNKLNVGVETNLEGYWRFYDDTTKNEIKFNSHVEVMNFMYQNGWIFKQFTQNDSAPVSNYIFEKKE